MLFLYIIMILVSLGLAGAFTMRRGARPEPVTLVLKTAASAAFVMLAFVSYRGSSGAVSIAIIPGLVMGLIGDIYLDLKYIYPKKSALYTNTGFAAFMLGHICFLIFLFSQYPFSTAGLIISLIIGLAAVCFIYIMPEKMELDFGQFHLISAVYAGLLVFVVIYSLCMCFAGFTGAKFMFFLGTLLFLFSDLVLSQIYFGKEKNTPMNSMINHGAYYLAQILIAASIMAI